MAENEAKQANSATKPVKKRRFFRPKANKPKAEQENVMKTETKQAPNQKQSQATEAKKKKQDVMPKPTGQPSTPKSKAKTNKINAVQNGKAKAEEKSVEAKQPVKLQQPKKATMKKLDAKAQVPHKSTIKNNSNFKPRKQAGHPRLKLTDINFEYLDTPKFKDIYALVTKAHSYFADDKETCCAKFRIANEAIISRLIKKLQLTEAVDETNYFEQINLLSKNISSEMVDENIFAEMHNIRMIGNSFAHGDDKYSPENGSKTCLIAMEKICRWLVEFEPKYDSYQRAKAATSSSAWDDILNGIKKLPSTIISLFKGK